MISCGARLAPFDIQELREIMSYDEMELDMIGDQRTAMFTMLGVALTDQIVFILLCCSPLLALAWCYVMYQISYRIFVKQEL